MKHLTPYRKNERSLSPVRGRGMVYGGEVITLSIDQRDEPFNILIRHAGDFTLVINRKQCYLNRVIVVLNEIECDNTSAPALAFPLRSNGHPHLTGTTTQIRSLKRFVCQFLLKGDEVVFQRRILLASRLNWRLNSSPNTISTFIRFLLLPVP